jgi:SAM-dependent methyltransferase
LTGPAHGFDPSAFWERRLTEFDSVAVGYSSLGAPYNRWLYAVRSRVFRRLIKSVRSSWAAARVLDVGSGTGFYVSEWLNAGATHVVASDLTVLATQRLAERFPDVQSVRWDAADEPPFRRGSFDAISVFDVLFHIVDDERYRSALANIAALLRDGGYLFLSENFVHGRSSRLTHQVNRPLSEIEDALCAVGLEVVTRRPMFVLMNAPVDSTNRALHHFWSLLQRAVARYETAGQVLGALLFPLELVLVSVLPEGPSTEAMICRKSASPHDIRDHRG